MKLLMIIFLELFGLSCCSVHKCNSNNTMEQTYRERQVRNFEEIPLELLNNFKKMGIDNSSILNEYEVQYLNTIFRTDTNNFQFFEKKIGFLGSKRDFFNDEKEWFYRGEKSGVGGTALYIFNSSQKEESGGYDGAIVYWSKFAIPIDKVVQQLKGQR